MLAESGSDFQEDKARSAGDDAALWKRFRGVAGEDAKVTALQRVKLTASQAETISLHIIDILPPDRRRGEALSRGIWRIGQQRLLLQPGTAPWDVQMPSRHFADRVHRFGWLADLMAEGEAAQAQAVALTDQWVSSFGKFDGFAWRLEVAASRIWNWLRCGAPLLEAGPDHARASLIDCLARQARYIAEVIDTAHDPNSRWMGAVVLTAYSLCLRKGAHLTEALDRLEAETIAQILPDGGHVTRSPAHLLSSLIHLQTIEDALQRSGRPVPAWLSSVIPRMGAMLAFFQAGDGGLDPFNDSDEARPEAVHAVLARLPAPPRRFVFAPKSGFQKIERGSLRIVLDCGEAPPRPFGDHARAGALGFELSDGRARLVTSCGWSAEVNVDWQAAVRRTSAHSTLVLSGRDSASFVLNDETRLRALIGPEGIAAKRLEEADEIWLDAQHAGYKTTHGLLHRRRLFVSGAGERVTGEDSLVRPVAQPQSEERKFVPYELRFHLHPTVTALMAKDSIRLICEDGRSWRFKTTHEGARLEKTIYLARGIVEQSEQILLSGFADPNGDGTQPPNCIRWAFIRESGAPSPA